jgi:tRNA dimethylallyltransferase
MAVAEILVILGATASGKSELAFELARLIGAQILSVDSMQVYRGMDVGTAKPTQPERALVRHHLIDIVEPDEIFTVARFVELADRVIADAAERNIPLIATGGTPLYFKSLFEGLFEGPGADPDLRERLRMLTGQELHERLASVDPVAAERIHVNDSKRLIRALEVHELTGQSITAHQQQWGGGRPRHPVVWIGLDWDRELLNRRINARARAMLAAGWVDEARALLARFGQLSTTAAQATGYHELIDHLRGNTTLDQATEQIKIATRQLARKQLKWFRRFPSVRWLPGTSDLQNKLAAVRQLWNPRGSIR